MTTSRRARLALLAVLVLAVAGALPVLAAPVARAGPAPGTLSGTISGPANVGTQGNGTYVVNVTGGPAVAANGTIVGTYSYNATVAGANTSGVVLSPASGVLLNGTGRILLKVSNVTQSVTISVLVTSKGGKANATTNLSYAVNVVTPYRFAATLVVGNGATLSGLHLVVDLDGAPVGSIVLGVLTGGSHTSIAYAYVNPDLAPGWHTFSVSLADEHGLVTFVGGAESISQSFYVVGPPPNDTVWYVGGAGVFVGVVFIWTTRVAATRRGRPTKK